jgi:hypothetical protein
MLYVWDWLHSEIRFHVSDVYDSTLVPSLYGGLYSFASIRFVVAPTGVVPKMDSKSWFSALHLCRNLQDLHLYQPIVSSIDVSENVRLSRLLKDGASSIPFGTVWYDGNHLLAPGLHRATRLSRRVS